MQHFISSVWICMCIWIYSRPLWSKFSTVNLFSVMIDHDKEQVRFSEPIFHTSGPFFSLLVSAVSR